MNKAEFDIQDALGLMHDWDVYVMFVNDDFFTIYSVKAPTKDVATQIGWEKIRTTGRKVKRPRNWSNDIHISGPDPEVRMNNAKRATKSC